MGNSFVLSGLVEERARRAGDIQLLKKKLAQAQRDLEHLDAVIRMMDPAFDTGAIRPKRTRKKTPGFKHGELTGMIIDTLRETGEPTTAEALCEAILAAKPDVEVDEEKLRDRVWVCLSSQVKQGMLHRLSIDGKNHWQIAA